MNKPNKQTTTPKDLISEFLKTIKEQFYSAKKLEGGTQNQTFLVNNSYIFKIGSANKVKAELIYNNYYHGEPFVQKLVFCDKNHRFIVYKLVVGELLPEYPNTKAAWKIVQKFTNNYKPYHEVGFGDVNKPSTSWNEFLNKLITDCKSCLKGVFTKDHFETIYEAIETLEQYEFEKVLLHGDLRLENFIFNENKLNGIIDPYPMSGDKLYDQIFFLFSTPKMAELLPLHKVHKKLKQPKEKVRAMMLIVLTVKLKRMEKYGYHQEQVAKWLSIWEMVKNLQ